MRELLQRRLRNKPSGSSNRHKLNQRIVRANQRISDTRKDWHFKLSHQLAKDAAMIFIEDINFVSWQRGMLSKSAADAGFGQFVNILKWVCWKTDTYFAKVNKDGTSQTCPNCGAHTGKKTLDVLVHHCKSCEYTTTRDVAASQEIRNRGIKGLHAYSALGHSVLEARPAHVVPLWYGEETSPSFLAQNVCGLDATGSISNSILVGTERNRKPES